MQVLHETPDRPLSPIWSSPSWRAEATAWIDQALASRGIRRTGEVEQTRVRAWSTQLRLQIDHGIAWMKACSPTGADEAAVYDVLGARTPELVLTPWATDAARGWLLLPDGGPTLRDVATSSTMLDQWAVVLHRYARLQRRAVDSEHDLLAAGLVRLTPEDLVRQWRRRSTPGDPLSGAEPVLQEAARVLQEGPVPLSLQHDDVHTNNVFCAGSSVEEAEAATFFDWGDSYIGHPFMSLLIALRGPRYHFDITMNDRERQRLIDAYLEPWTELAPLTELRRLVAPAVLLGRVGRVLGWERSMSGATDEEWAEWRAHPEHWLSEVTELAASGADVW
ncbi:phosphotransferase [Luteipulveratus mongoliensis]|uniref:Uncharacterized protein n=1 Tax=Luteipulveratus mongoliensis TaxID=571913 RepID=A0A0K1JKE7_9MICO|nr:phosphotransferase [Luteipulveratus mongoliensis]AKU17063.1 hypothetical protein VV02_16310 [Luteipulveratus mongoliensis]